MEAKLPDWPIIDMHVHLPVQEDEWLSAYRKRFMDRFGKAKLDQVVFSPEMQDDGRMLNWSFPRPRVETQSWEELADKWMEEVRRYRLSRVVLLTGGGNELLSRVVARHPDQFTGFAHHDPFLPNAAGELERALTLQGLRGYKIFATLMDRRLDDEALFPVWDVAERHKAPVLVHFGPLGGKGGVGTGVNISPLVLHDVAKAFPGIPFIVPHLGGGYPRELMHLAWACPNVHTDTSGSMEWLHWLPYDLDFQTLFRRFYEAMGPERMIFGTNSSWFPRGFEMRQALDQLRVCKHLRIPTEHQQLIFGGNAARLLRLGFTDVATVVPGDPGYP